METSVEIKFHNFFIYFTAILYEAMPFIVLGAVIAGLLEELVPQELIARIMPRRRIFAILIGGFLGILFPMCECGIIPVMRRLLRKGLPLSCCVAYLLAGPVINVVVLGATWAAFSSSSKDAKLMIDKVTIGNVAVYQMGSAWMVGMRAGLVYLVAVTTALIVERLHKRYGNKLLMPLAIPPSLPSKKDEAEEEVTADPRPWSRRLGAIAETALHDFVDITVFLILGAMLSAGVRLMVSHDWVANKAYGYPVFSIVLMMALAIILCLCSEADAFVAASFRALPSSAKLAFLVLGPMLDFKLYMMYARVFRPRLIFTIFASVIALTFTLSFITHLLWEHFAPLLYSS